jgi:isopropylmalate/homocitrate/citramalate synthase
LGLVRTIVAKGKGRARSKLLGIAASQAESIASIATEATQALLKSIKEIRESSNKEQVSNKQLQALCKCITKQKEYTILL